MRIMKFMLVLFLVVIFKAESKEIYWYLAASMTKPAKEIVQLFNSKYKNDSMILITGGSGELLSKIYASKKGELYTPADETFLNRAINMGVIKKYKPILVQEPVFALSNKTRHHISKIEEICKENIKIAIGNPKTMAIGKTFETMKKQMPIDLYKCINEKKAIDPINISQTVNYLKNNVVDLGLLFKSTAKVNNLKYIELPPTWNIKVKAYLAKLIYSNDDNVTERAINFIEDNLNIFKANGFDTLK